MSGSATASIHWNSFIPALQSGERIWTLHAFEVAIAVLACIVVSTQLLFQRDVYNLWSTADIVGAWLRQLRDLLVVAGAIMAALAATSLLRARGRWASALLFLVVVFGGAFAGEMLSYWLLWDAIAVYDVPMVLVRAARWLPVGIAVGAVVVLRQRAQVMAAAAHEATVRQLNLERQTLELQLQVLKAQVEPHFLFNTLATVRRLQESDAERGRQTLASFIRYLRAAMPELRGHETSLGREIDLVSAYLEVLAARMEDRMQSRVDVPDQLRSYALPTLSLATLVENAIKHGLGRLPEGGVLTIRGNVAGDALVLQVADTGPGLTTSEGAGSGLSNLRARLAALYGDQAAITLAPNRPRGLVATLRVPLRDTSRRDT